MLLFADGITAAAETDAVAIAADRYFTIVCIILELPYGAKKYPKRFIIAFI